MGVVRFAEGVRLFRTDATPLRPAGVRILSSLDRYANSYSVDVLVTCGTEGHPQDDPHSRGEALDIHCFDWPEQRVIQARTWFLGFLGPDFTPLYEVPADRKAELSQALQAIAYPNPKATGIHFHLQLRKGYGEWPKPLPVRNTRTV